MLSSFSLFAQVELSNSVSIDVLQDSVAQTSVNLSNAGTQRLTYTLTTTAADASTEPYADRISLSRTSGTLQFFGSLNITVSVDMLDIPVGSYVWSLNSVDGAGNRDSLTVSVNVLAPVFPSANFSVPGLITCSGSVVFTNETEMALSISTYQWMFGDGQTSTEEEPTHTYDTTGIYTVTLVTCNGINCDTIVKTDYIEVIDTLPGCEVYTMEPDRTTKLISSCNLQAYDTGGRDGNYLPNRTNNLWINGGGANSRIRIYFDQFELGGGANISISNSDGNLNNTLIATYTSNNPPPDVLESNRNFIFVTFRSGPEAAPGFSLRTECFEPNLTLEDIEVDVVGTGCNGEANFRVFPVLADHIYEYTMPDSIVVRGVELTDLTYAFTSGGDKEVALVVTSPDEEQATRTLRFSLSSGVRAGSITGPDNLETGQSGNFRFNGSPTFAVYRWYTSDGRRFDNQSARIAWDEPGTYFLHAASNGPNECQYAAIKTVTVERPSSVGSQEGESQFAVFPNPVSEELVVAGKIAYTGQVQFHILDMSGKVVKKGNRSWVSRDEFSMNVRVSDLPQGSYFIKIMDDNGRRFGVRHFVKI